MSSQELKTCPLCARPLVKSSGYRKPNGGMLYTHPIDKKNVCFLAGITTIWTDNEEHVRSWNTRPQSEAGLKEALKATRAIVSEGAQTGFNCHEGDWAERLYANQAAISRALASTAVVGEDDPDEAYKLGVEDGYSRGVADADLRTFGDGEYTASLGGGSDSAADPQSMLARMEGRVGLFKQRYDDAMAPALSHPPAGDYVLVPRAAITAAVDAFASIASDAAGSSSAGCPEQGVQAIHSTALDAMTALDNAAAPLLSSPSVGWRENFDALQKALIGETGLSGIEAATRIREVLTLWFTPWGAAKSAMWEEASGDRPFDPNVCLELLAKAVGVPLPPARGG